MYPSATDMAKEMLNLKELPNQLEYALKRATTLAEKMGGTINSRQAVAAIIVAWELSNE